MAAALARAAELMHAEAGAPKAVDVITTDDRKKLLFERKEQERLAKEKAEREAAEAELKKAMEEAREKTKPDLLAAPLRRAKRAVEASVPLIEQAEKVRAELEAEIRENERLARLERERVEREAATEELKMAMQAAKDSRDAALLGKPIRRAKKAVEFDAALLKGAEELKTELDEERKEKERVELEEKREKERLEKLERERVEPYLPHISPVSPLYLPRSP